MFLRQCIGNVQNVVNEGKNTKQTLNSSQTRVVKLYFFKGIAAPAEVQQHMKQFNDPKVTPQATQRLTLNDVQCVKYAIV